MHYRVIHSKVANEYLPQDKWLIRGDGKVIDLLSGKGEVAHDPRHFIIEAWTGFLDSKGKKIYCGDILEMKSFFDFKSKVIWKDGGFWMVPLDPEGTTDAMRNEEHIRVWTITGNVHGVEFSQ